MADLSNTIKTALVKYPDAFPTERGLEVRHPNGTQELLVFYRGLNEHEFFKTEDAKVVEEEASQEETVEEVQEEPKKRGRKPKEETVPTEQ